jgi:hypothetical protein
MSGKKFQIYGSIIIMLIIASCSGTTKLSPEDKAATAQFLAATIIVETEQASIPTITSTSQPTETATPTQTITSTPTEEPILLPTETTEYVPPTPTETPFLAAYMVTLLKFINQSGQNVYFKFTSPIQEEYSFSGSFSIKVPFGTYYYLAWIGDEGPFSGSIDVKGYDKIELLFKADKVKIVYP